MGTQTHIVTDTWTSSCFVNQASLQPWHLFTGIYMHANKTDELCLKEPKSEHSFMKYDIKKQQLYIMWEIVLCVSSYSWSSHTEVHPHAGKTE